MKKIFFLLSFFVASMALFAQKKSAPKNADNDSPREVNFSMIATTDIHGNYFPYDFINRKSNTGGLSRVSSYLRRLRNEKGAHNVVYVDNGDLLQGQPAAYYYNYVDTESPHVAAAMLNYFEPLCATVGNHDIEVGRATYNRWMDQCSFAVLGANVGDTKTKMLAYTAYIMEDINGINVGVIGLTTPIVAKTVPESRRENLVFKDIVAEAQRIVPKMKGYAKADVIVVLVHSGVGELNSQGAMLENVAYQIAEQVKDVDIVIAGHDHRLANQVVANKLTGKKVIVINPGFNGDYVARVDFKFQMKGKKAVASKRLEGNLVSMASEEPDPIFLEKFKTQFEEVKAYCEKVVGHCPRVLETRTAFFGSSPFVDFIHKVQLRVSGADISFAAPLSFDAEVPAGEVRMGDLFNLYQYENTLYTLKMTGAEVKKYLEESYGKWVNQMLSPTDHMLQLRDDAAEKTIGWQRLKFPSYNFDSAAGIKYTVDLRKPKGSKVKILSMANGEPFDPLKTYKVAMNSYRALGGGDFLTNIGISQAMMKQRIVWSSPKEMRHYVMEEFGRTSSIDVDALEQWKFIPESWRDNAGERDAELLFKK